MAYKHMAYKCSIELELGTIMLEEGALSPLTLSFQWSRRLKGQSTSYTFVVFFSINVEIFSPFGLLLCLWNLLAMAGMNPSGSTFDLNCCLGSQLYLEWSLLQAGLISTPVSQSGNSPPWEDFSIHHVILTHKAKCWNLIIFNTNIPHCYVSHNYLIFSVTHLFILYFTRLSIVKFFSQLA